MYANMCMNVCMYEYYNIVRKRSYLSVQMVIIKPNVHPGPEFCDRAFLVFVVLSPTF